MATTATKTEHSNSNTASHSTAGTTHKPAASTAQKTTTGTANKTGTKTAGKRRGGYSFGTASGDSASSSAKKGTRRGTGAGRKGTGARGSASNASSSARNTSGSARTGRSNLDLGFASIAKSASDTARQNTAAFSRTAGKTSNAYNGAFANVATNAKQVQEKVSNLGREFSSNLQQSASRAAESTNRSLEMHRSNAEALGQSYSAAQEAMKEASQELFQFFNNAFTQNVEAARQALECRNIGEFFQIHNDRMKQNMESAVEQALRMSEIAIETATAAIEPINDSVTKNSRKYARENA